jgi:hypothetical protein
LRSDAVERSHVFPIGTDGLSPELTKAASAPWSFWEGAKSASFFYSCGFSRSCLYRFRMLVQLLLLALPDVLGRFVLRLAFSR